ncbi:tellurite resistance TerB family protein [Roseomonas terrae]|uniref:Tellurite resistance TerB family protein n=1 Tax=Neoroseomonas terrae TaxID=424799 RepID=A0ABS5EAU9_9PROT|nr:tellurite resistance TerB family protein [Neoroseomonas terrae]MBR0648151.1 tellurite resistance TerB family protein [Neoroseomonas terrae]
MIDAQALLNRFLGAGSGSTNQAMGQPNAAPSALGGAGGIADKARQVLGQGGVGGLAGAAAAGGLLSLLVGKKKGRGGSFLSHGGAALLGALADRAVQNWQAGRQPAGAVPPTQNDVASVDPRFLPGAAPAAGGEPFELSLIRAMIGAARADGHIDAEEHRRIFAQVEQAGLDAEAKAFVFDTLNAPVGVSEVAAAATTQEQASELYLVSRLAVDPDDPSERAYLEALAHRLKLPGDLVAHLDRQADMAASGQR